MEKSGRIRVRICGEQTDAAGAVVSAGAFLPQAARDNAMVSAKHRQMNFFISIFLRVVSFPCLFP